MLSGLERSSIDFSRSAGVYGEIEDVARRIVWYMEASNTSPSICHCGTEYVDGAGCCAACVWVDLVCRIIFGGDDRFYLRLA